MIKMIGKNVLLQIIDEYESASGIYVAGPIEKQNTALVIAASPECDYVREGQKVVFDKGIVATNINGEKYYTASEESILAIIED